MPLELLGMESPVRILLWVPENSIFRHTKITFWEALLLVQGYPLMLTSILWKKGKYRPQEVSHKGVAQDESQMRLYDAYWGPKPYPIRAEKTDFNVVQDSYSRYSS